MTAVIESRTSRVGIVLQFGLPRDDASWGVEVQRAPDSSGAPDTGNAATREILPPGRDLFIDIVGAPGPYWYRARTIRPKATEGAWTDWVGARPVPIPATLPSKPQTAEILGCTIDFDANGEVVVSVTGDYDTAAIYVTVGDGSAPSDPTSSTNDGSVSARSGVISTGVKITTGNQAIVKVVGADPFASLGEVRSFRNGRRIGPFSKDTSTRSHTGDTSETTLDTITISAGALGSNGSADLEVWGTLSGTNGTKTLRLRLDGTAISGFFFGSSVQGDFWMRASIFNDGATNAQVVAVVAIVSQTGGPAVFIDNQTSAAVDSTADMDLTINAQLGNSADTMSLITSRLTFSGTD